VATHFGTTVTRSVLRALWQRLIWPLIKRSKQQQAEVDNLSAKLKDIAGNLQNLYLRFSILLPTMGALVLFYSEALSRLSPALPVGSLWAAQILLGLAILMAGLAMELCFRALAHHRRVLKRELLTLQDTLAEASKVILTKADIQQLAQRVAFFDERRQTGRLRNARVTMLARYSLYLTGTAAGVVIGTDIVLAIIRFHH